MCKKCDLAQSVVHKNNSEAVLNLAEALAQFDQQGRSELAAQAAKAIELLLPEAEAKQSGETGTAATTDEAESGNGDELFDELPPQLRELLQALGVSKGDVEVTVHKFPKV